MIDEYGTGSNVHLRIIPARNIVKSLVSLATLAFLPPKDYMDDRKPFKLENSDRYRAGVPFRAFS
jgi:hypothetical protein